MKTYEWCAFYNLFAHKLLEYKNKRPGLIEIIKSVFSEIGIKLPTLEKDNKIIDIDPFTVFGLFNKGITTKNRKKILAALAKKIGITEDVPNDFSGIPVLNNFGATFYSFSYKTETLFDDLWQLFERALDYADSNAATPSDDLCQSFDKALAMKYNGNSKITMGLFWIAPEKFLNLDSRNEWYIYKSGKLPQDFINTLPEIEEYISSKTYFDITRKMTDFLKNAPAGMKTFVGLSEEAWRYSQEVNEEKTKLKQDEVNTAQKATDDGNWFAADYSPGLTVDDWVKLLNDPDVFYFSSLEIMKRLYDFGGIATCKQLSEKYGETPNFYNNGSWQLGKRVHKKTACNILTDNNDNSKWWPILYTGRYAEDKNISGIYIWKLRPELAEALKQVDLSAIKLYADLPSEAVSASADAPNYWWLNANPKMWSMSATPVGQVQDYTLYNDQHHKRRIFQNFLDAKVGDMIIGYESTPVKQIVALFQISKEQDGERIYFKKIEHLAVPIDLATLQTQSELAEMEFFKNSQTSLLKLSAAEYDCIINLIRDVNPLPQVRKIEEYGAKNFLSDVFMNRGKYDSLVHILQDKKNIILQGAPGVGKTFAARRLAYSIMGVKDDSRIEFVQFHQNYSYEDFVMGYKPNENGFELKNGIFYSFCQKAASVPDKDYFFIIDEINRGNMSKIFGELLMLIEKDYRGTPLTLAYNGLPFHVPKNLHIIGMMNTADRSLAMIDYALRRRFSFFDMEPGFDSDGFTAYQQALNSEKLDKLVTEIKTLNQTITEDKSLGKGFCIGHSYLCGEENCTDEWLQGVVYYDILPMLAEYWFDELDKYDEWKKRLTDAVK